MFFGPFPLPSSNWKKTCSGPTFGTHPLGPLLCFFRTSTVPLAMHMCTVVSYREWLGFAGEWRLPGL